MDLIDAKVTFNGSHYIATRHTTNNSIRRPKPPEKQFEVEWNDSGHILNKSDPTNLKELVYSLHDEPFDDSLFDTLELKDDLDDPDDLFFLDDDLSPPATTKDEFSTVATEKLTRVEIFNLLYKQHLQMKRADQRKVIISEMRQFFSSKQELIQFVDHNFEKKYRNYIVRKYKLTRRAKLHEFTYFATFTYDDKKHNETSFRKNLMMTLTNFRRRHGWRYIGAWEHSPEKHRLHFHALLYVPEGTMPDILIEHLDYSIRLGRMQKTVSCPYFDDKFGRSDFRKINDDQDKCTHLEYLSKYISKSEERLVYSKGLGSFIKCDVRDEDIIMPLNEDGYKFILRDDFECWKDGNFFGKVSPEVIEKMPPSD